MICFRRVDKSTTNWICFLLVAKTLSATREQVFIFFAYPNLIYPFCLGKRGENRLLHFADLRFPFDAHLYPQLGNSPT